MNNLGNFLEKFKNIIGHSKFQKDAVLSIIKESVGIQLEEKDVEIKNFTVYIKASPLVKNEIFMRKQFILAKLKAILGNKSPKDIR